MKMFNKIDPTLASVCDVTAGYSPTGLKLDIFVPTKSPEEHAAVKEAIRQLIEKMGFALYKGEPTKSMDS